MSEYVKSFKAASQEPGVFEKINNQDVSNKEWGQYVASRKLMAAMNQQPEASLVQLKHDFNLNKVLYQHAVKLNLVISDPEAKNYAIQTRANLNNSSNAAQINEMISKVQESLGVTEEQYWNQVAPEQYKMGLSIGKLRDHVKHEFMDKNPKATAGDLEQAADQFAEDLLLQATIK